MARYHISIPDSVMQQLDEMSIASMIPRSKFISRGIMMALDDARKRFSEPANEPVAAPIGLAVSLPSPDVPAAPAAPFRPSIVIDEPQTEMIKSIKRGDTVWFDMDQVCDHLSIEVDSLMGEIDGDDDILAYAGREWIDSPGVTEAIALSRDQEAKESFWAFVQSKVA
jgi:hypothetical protein